MGLGISEIIVILIVGLVVLGPQKLPEIARMVGKGLNELRKLSTDFQRTINTEIAHEEEKKREADIAAKAADSEKAVADAKAFAEATRPAETPAQAVLDAAKTEAAPTGPIVPVAPVVLAPLEQPPLPQADPVPAAKSVPEAPVDELTPEAAPAPRKSLAERAVKLVDGAKEALVSPEAPKAQEFVRIAPDDDPLYASAMALNKAQKPFEPEPETKPEPPAVDEAAPEEVAKAAESPKHPAPTPVDKAAA